VSEESVSVFAPDHQIEISRTVWIGSRFGSRTNSLALAYEETQNVGQTLVYAGSLSMYQLPGAMA